MKSLFFCLIITLPFSLFSQSIVPEWTDTTFNIEITDTWFSGINDLTSSDSSNFDYTMVLSEFDIPNGWEFSYNNGYMCFSPSHVGTPFSGHPIQWASLLQVNIGHNWIPGQGMAQFKFWPDDDTTSVTTITYNFNLSYPNLVSSQTGFGVSIYDATFSQDPIENGFLIENELWNTTGQNLDYEFMITNLNIPIDWSVSIANDVDEVTVANDVLAGVASNNNWDNDKIDLECNHNGVNGVGLVEIFFWPANDPSALQKIDYTFAVGGVGFEEQSLRSLNVYPNPCVDYFTIGLDKGINDQVLSLHGLDGRLIGEFEVGDDGRVDVSGVSSGTYVVREKNKNGVGVSSNTVAIKK